MNKQLKFRAWDNKNKKWLLGYEYPNLGGFSLFGEMVLMGEWANILSLFLFENKGYKSSDLIVTQFTGLKDKNEKDIYEADFVSHKFKRAWETKLHVSKVIWNQEYCCYYLFDGISNHRMRDDMIYDVIGNEFENNIQLLTEK
jgi:uncharacterized phage protein (TIGR01671 family)